VLLVTDPSYDRISTSLTLVSAFEIGGKNVFIASSAQAGTQNIWGMVDLLHEGYPYGTGHRLWRVTQ